MEQLSASITIASHLKGTTFPYHTDPEFEITGGFVDGMGGIMSAAYAPLIEVADKEQWEEYALAHQDWIETSAYLKAVHPVHRDALHGTIQDHEHDRRLQEETPNSTSISKEIYRRENGVKVRETSEPGKVLAPLWQVSPADYSAVNENLMSDPRIKEAYGVMRRAEHVIMTSPTEIGDLVSASSGIKRRTSNIGSISRLNNLVHLYRSLISYSTRAKRIKRYFLIPSFFPRSTKNLWRTTLPMLAFLWG
jgi:hypothetical protein